MKNKIKIIWSNDYSDCETCGGNWDEGAVVYFNDECIMNRPAHASCTGGEFITTDIVLKAILEHLDIELEEEYV